MNNSDRLAEVLQDSSDVMLFQLVLAEKLKAVTSVAFGTCHIQSLLDTAIANETSENIGALSLNIKTAIDDLYPDRVSVETVIDFVTEALDEMSDGIGGGNAESVRSIDEELDGLSF